MATGTRSTNSAAWQRGGFASTRWSLVAAAGSDSTAALTDLCLRYWYPVYAYGRRCGHAPEAAQAITQAFFQNLLGERLRTIGSERPHRFRTWLLAELARFVAHDWDGKRTSAAAVPVTLPAPLPIEVLEQRHRAAGAAMPSADADFRRNFALELVGRALERLREEAAQAGHDAMFEALLLFLANEPPAGQFETIARDIGSGPLALVVALKRLRQRFRELTDAELAEIVGSAEVLEAERAALRSALRGDA